MINNYTPEQQLRFKEIELNTERALRKCCSVQFEGKERELNLMEKNNRDLMNCKIQNIRNSVCCCQQRGL